MIHILKRIRIFSQETILELKKASWPTKIELRDSTIVVLIAAALLGVCIFIADWALFNWVSFLGEWVSGGFYK